MIRDVATAVDLDDVDAGSRTLLGIEQHVLHRRAATQRVDRRVLEQQHGVVDRVALPLRCDVLLQRPGGPVLDGAELHDA